MKHDDKPHDPVLVSTLAPLLDLLLEKLAGRRLGFAIIVFDFDQEPVTKVDYTSNAPRHMMITVIRAWLNQQTGRS